MIDLYDNKIYYIGKKEDLLRFIARKFKTYHYLDSSRWSNEIFEDLNMNFNDSKALSTYDFENSKYNYYIIRYLFYDGEKRIIDIRNFYEEIIKNFKELSEYNEIFEILKRHKEKYKKKQHRKHHSGNAFKGRMPKIRRTKVLNNNPEMKEFVRQRDKEFPDWWDDTIEEFLVVGKTNIKHLNSGVIKNILTLII